MRTFRLAALGTIIAALLGCAAEARQRAQQATQLDLPQHFFPIMTWDLPPQADALFSSPAHGLESLAECGFTTAGFVRPQHLPACEKLGLQAIVCDRRGILKWREMSDRQIEETVHKLVEESGHSSAIMGYFITDEPGVGEFPALAKAVAAVKRFAPGKLAYINLYPDYATLGAPNLSQLGTDSYSEYLERFVREVKPQVISYDNYQVQYSMDQKEAGPAASYYNNLLEVRRVAQKYGLPFWNIVSSNQIRPHTPVPSPANSLLQAYTTLAAGGQGLTWYKYYQGGYQYAPIDNSGARTATWSYLKMVNEQVKVVGSAMLDLKSTGVYFTTPAPAPAPVSSLPKLPGQLVQSIECPVPLMAGEFTGAGDRKYVMLVNLSLRDSASLKFKLRVPAHSIRHLSPVAGSWLVLPADNSLWLTAGQGVLLDVGQ